MTAQTRSATDEGVVIAPERFFTDEENGPYEGIDWEFRTARVGAPDNPKFEQRNVEVPSFWSQNATDIVAEKYFAYKESDPRRETSIRGMIDRVAGKITEEGVAHGYFSEEQSKVFYDELRYALIHQMVSFNSPVWFNIGVEGVPQTSSACFILSVKDDMDSITTWYKEEAKIFKAGSGAGVNLSRLRASGENLSRGGASSGPVTFSRAADASAGTIRSGGRTRRAAKMLRLDIDHPDVEDFITCKAREEERIRALAAAGFDMSIGSEAGERNLAEATAYQNANQSVGLTDEFMEAVEADGDWDLIGRTDGAVMKTVKARYLFDLISDAAWRCADPGVQFDTIINDWHTTPAQGPITSSNPCFPADSLVHTVKGLMPISELYERFEAGEKIDIYTHRQTAGENGAPARRKSDGVKVSSPLSVTQNGVKEVLKLKFANGAILRCTPNHRIWTLNRGYAAAEDLTESDQVMFLETTKQHRTKGFTTLKAREVDGQEIVYNLSEPLHHSYIVGGFVVANCSEYLSNDNTACNLASLNLMKFLKPDGTFNIDEFRRVTSLIFLAQEITVAFAKFPTRKIEKNARDFRQIGTGYANLGAMLMAMGLPYDSDQGRNVAAAVTSLLTATCYETSGRIAERMGSFTHFEENREDMVRVLKKHRKASRDLTEHEEFQDVVEAANHAWNSAVTSAKEAGIRNAQATVLAPTGTISFMMDCDTTGVEPDFALVKHKTLVGGGTMEIINRTVPLALHRLGYDQETVNGVVAYIEDEEDGAPRGHVIGAPGLKDEHESIFECAIGEQAIKPIGHIKMLGAVQPFLSGASSKTINLPADATREDIGDVYMEGWKLGIKAIAVYRDGSKSSQPLSDRKEDSESLSDRMTSLLGDGLLRGERRRVPRDGDIEGVNFNIGGSGGYVHVRLFDDGTPGAVFVDVGQAGSTLHGFIRAWAITMSLGLQYGLPMDVLASKLSWTQFEPQGITDDPEIRTARSIVDYVIRWMANRFLDLDEISRASLGLRNGDPEDPAPAIPGGEITPKNEVKASTRPSSVRVKNTAEICPNCSMATLIRTGTCMTCTSCGENSGCG